MPEHSSLMPPLATKSLREILDFLGGNTRLEGNDDWKVKGVNSLEEAGPQDLSFCVGATFAKKLATSRAGCVMLPIGMPTPKSSNYIRCENPKASFARVLGWLYQPLQPKAGIHRDAWIDENAIIDPSASVMAGVYVGAHSEIGANCILYPGVVVMEYCHLGRGCILHPRVTLREQTVLGSNVILHAGVVLGGDGHGYIREKDGHLKMPQVGRVVIEDGVDIGSLSNVDRATLGVTKVGAGSKIDSLVHVGHNVVLGKRVMILGNSALAGGTILEDDVIIGGSSGILPSCRIGQGSIVHPYTLVTKNLPKKSDVYGIPARPLKEEFRRQAHISQLDKLQQKIKAMEKKLCRLSAIISKSKISTD